MKVLAGDIGGTKTLLHIAEVNGSHITVLHEARYASRDFVNFETLLQKFLDAAPADLRKAFTAACFGVAAPIAADAAGRQYAKVTNLPWTIEQARLQNLLHISRIELINDIFAAASAIDILESDKCVALTTGVSRPRAPRLVVGAGTGLGVAQVMWCGDRYHAFSSEGGHIHFAATDALQIELLAFMRQRHERVSYERLVSGPGLVAIYEFFLQRETLTAAHRAVLDNSDPAAIITDRARHGDAMARQSIKLFLSLYGAVVGDLALITLAHGGVYLMGGIAPKLLSEIRDGGFLAAYKNKGRMSALVSQMPVYIVISDNFGLCGASLIASRA